MSTYYRGLEDLARGNRTWIRQLIVDMLTVSFGTPRVEEPPHTSIEMIDGSVMVTDEAGELVLRVTNTAKAPIKHLEIALLPSAEYDLFTQRVSLFTRSKALMRRTFPITDESY